MLSLLGCNPNINPEQHRQVMIFFSARSSSVSLLKSTANDAENIIAKIKLFGVDDQGKIVESFPVMDNPSSTGLKLTIPKYITSFYAIANPCAILETSVPANISDVMALTGDFTNAPQSPFLMGGRADVKEYSVNIELVRSVAKIMVSGEDGFEIQSVTVKNTPAKGFVFAQSALTTPSTDRVDYPETDAATIYVAENSRQSPTTLTVNGAFNGKLYEVNVNFEMNGKHVDVIRNTSYSIVIGSIAQDYYIKVSIRDWDDQEIDRHYFDPNCSPN